MTKLDELAHLGQAIWFDYIRRSFITSGELQALIDEGLRGVTSNPTIFEKAIAGSTDYDEDLRRLVEAGKTVEEIYEALAQDDIRRAADLLRPVYEQTDGADGYVSLEVNPNLAHNTEGTIAEARRLFKDGMSPLEASKQIDVGPYAEWTEPERLIFNVARAFREFRGEPWDAPFGDAVQLITQAQELRAHWQG